MEHFDRAGQLNESGRPLGSMWGFALYHPHIARAEVYRNPVSQLWPSVWTHKSNQFAVDGYLVHSGRLLGGQSAIEQTTLAQALLSHPREWLRSIQNGCFNIIIHDHRARRTLIISDRFGFLPLYVLRHPDGVWFASDLATLRTIAPTKPVLDQIGIAELYWFGYQIGHRTAYRNVAMVPPGSILSFPWDGSTEQHITWEETEANTERSKAANFRDIPFRLRELVESACHRLHNPAFGYGIKLSGGLDSRLIAACWRPSSLHSYTWGDPHSAEVHLAKRLALRLRFDHRTIAVENDFFPGRYMSMFRRYGIMEFLHELATPFMQRDNANLILDGLVGDVFIGGGYFDDARKASFADLFRSALGLRYKHGKLRLGNDELVLKLTKIIRVEDSDFPILETSALRQIRHLDDDIHHDIAQIVAKLTAEDDMLESVVAKFMLLCRTRRYTALQGATNRPEIQTLYPFIDTDLLHFLNGLPVGHFQYRDLYRRIFTESLPTIKDIPAIRSRLPFYFPRPVHAMGRVVRGSLERIGKTLLRTSRGRWDAFAMDAVQWERWLAQNTQFRQAIHDQLSAHHLVNQNALSQTLHAVGQYRHSVVGTRLMLTASFLLWHQDRL